MEGSRKMEGGRKMEGSREMEGSWEMAESSLSHSLSSREIRYGERTPRYSLASCILLLL
jgi:hypothetical protein